jgi:8-oxo-dGTP pyrophosphatase MutT (NUDIX family)
MSPYFKQLRARIGHDLLLMPSVAAVIRDAEGRLLLQEKASGEGWSLPAGAIEPGESPEQAVEREVREETGLVVAAKEIIGVFGGRGFRCVYPNGDAVEYTVVLFRCSAVREAGVAQRLSRFATLRWADAKVGVALSNRSVVQRQLRGQWSDGQ